MAADRSSNLAAGSLVGVMFINMLGFGIIIPLLPFYGQALNADPWQIALIFSAFSMGAFFGEPVWGRLSDRIGRKPLLLSTVTGTMLCYLALAFAPDIWTAFVIRFVGGAASGNGSVMQGYIADVTAPEKRARRLSWIGASASLGLVVGPSIGGIFAQTHAGPAGFRVPLLIAAGLSATCLVAIMLFIREPLRTREVRPHQSRLEALGEVTSHPVIGRLMLLTFLVGFAFTGIESVFGLWGEARFAWGPKEVGWCFAFAGAVSAVTQFFVTGPLSERFGEARVLAAGMALTVLGCLGQIWSTGIAMTTVLLAVTALGQSVSWPNVGALISRNADPAKQGQVLGLNNATGALARFVGPLTAGLAFAHLSIDAPFVIAALIVAPAILLALSAAGRASGDQAR
ncbi:MFS transporter [Sphingomonas sp.]|jgi:MFS family permease|uniref:MFS transporter n=1 Tax=Sphingomonas sp. TaxID=28214 RepID=UPI002D7E81CB|nr:MFS transporter [Sphingomonas sp.]HEU0043338.1 MFS transporter [Sphingomonas sp.]